MLQGVAKSWTGPSDSTEVHLLSYSMRFTYQNYPPLQLCDQWHLWHNKERKISFLMDYSSETEFPKVYSMKC